jgi:hypothetical protein
MAVSQKPMDLLRATSLMLVVESLVWVKSHFPEVDMVKVSGRPRCSKRPGCHKGLDAASSKEDNGRHRLQGW